MSALRKSTEVDGLSLVRAVRHARTGAPEPAPPPSEPPPKQPEPAEGEPRDRAARIGRTAMPTRQEIHCYECGYTFQATGRVHSLLCPKCRHTLDQSDYTIDAECTERVRTTGNIRLSAGAVLVRGALIGRDIVLAGKVEGGTLKANRRLVIEAGAAFDQDLVAAQDLTIGPGAACRFTGRRIFRAVEVAGELDGHFACSGLIHVRAGGHLKGRIHGAHLCVEEGGGLTAELEIAPPARPA